MPTTWVVAETWPSNIKSAMIRQNALIPIFIFALVYIQVVWIVFNIRVDLGLMIGIRLNGSNH